MGQATSIPLPSQEKPTSQQHAQNLGKKYIVVDVKKGELNLIDDDKQASSPKKIHEFVMANFTTLTHEQADILLKAKLKHTITPNSNWLDRLVDKIDSAISFIFNKGKTDKQLLKEIHAKVTPFQRVDGLFKQQVKLNGLEKELNKVLLLQQQLKGLNNELAALIQKKTSNESIDPSLEKAIATLEGKIDAVSDELAKQRHMLRGRTFSKQIGSLQNAVKILKDDPPAVQAAKQQVLKANKRFFKAMAAIKFNETAPITVPFAHSEQTMRLSIPTTFKDSDTGDAEDLSVSKQVQVDLGEVRGKKIDKTVTFENLQNQEMDDLELEEATANKIFDLAEESVLLDQKEASNFIAGQLAEIVKKLPDPSITTLDDLRKALKTQVAAKNVEKHELDKETFEIMVDKKTKFGGVPIEYINAPEYKKALAELRNGEWEDGQTRILSLTQVRDIEPYMQVIDDFFADQNVSEALQSFLSREE